MCAQTKKHVTITVAIALFLLVAMLPMQAFADSSTDMQSDLESTCVEDEACGEVGLNETSVVNVVEGNYSEPDSMVVDISGAMADASAAETESVEGDIVQLIEENQGAQEAEDERLTESAIETENAGCLIEALTIASERESQIDREITLAAESEMSVQANGSLAEGVYAIASSISNSARVEIGGASTSNGAATQVYSDNWTPAQRWYITSLNNGYYKLMNVASGKYLDVAGANVGNSARVQQYAWNGSKAQQWAIVSTSSGYQLYSALSSAYVLDLAGANTTNGTAVQLYQSNGTKAQYWSLTRIEAVLPNGLYTATSKASNKVLDVDGASVQNGANVQQYDSNGTMAQDFFLSYDSSNGYYTVIGSSSGLVLDVYGACNVNGANVQMYNPNGTWAQQWAIAKNSDGTYTLRSATGGRVLDVNGASKANGANVQLYNWNSTNAQRWTFSSPRAWSIAEGVYNIVTGVNRSNSVAVAGSSRAESANVQTLPTATTSWGQKWLFAKASDGFYTIRNMNSLNMLDVAGTSAKSGSNVQQAAADNADDQLWKPELTAGGIIFRSKTNSSLVLDISGASTAVGANVQIYSSNGTVAQKFAIISVNVIDSGKTFTFSNVAADKVLDVEAASTNNGAVVQLYESNGTVAQRFRVVSASGNKYYLQNVKSDKFITVNPNDKTSVYQWEGQSGTDKQWELVLDKQTGIFRVKSVSTGQYLDGTAGTLSLKASSSTDAQRFVLLPSMFKVFLDAGHIVGKEGYDPGAEGNGYREADLTSDLTDRIFKICRDEYGIDIVDGKTYGISYDKRTGKAIELDCTVFVSIHFNATGDGSGSGCMSIVGGPDRRNVNSMTLTQIMNSHLVSAMSGIGSYGISVRDDLAVVNNGGIAATLLEVAFIDNSGDMQYYNARRDAIARSIAEGILEASKRGEFNA